MGHKNNMMLWVQEVKKGREMCEAVVDVLSQNEYSVDIFGIKVDNSVFQLIATVIGILLYIIGWFVYQKWIAWSLYQNAL